MLTSTLMAIEETWTGNTDQNWGVSSNWLQGSPSSGSIAFFGIDGSTTVNVDSPDCIAASLDFSGSVYLLTAGAADPTTHLLTLSPNAGTAINIGSTTVFGTVQIYLDNSGTIHLQDNTLLTLENQARIKGIVSLEVTGSAFLLINGGNTSLASVLNRETVGTVSITAASITNYGLMACAFSSGTIQDITITTSSLDIQNLAKAACAETEGTLGRINLNAEYLLNNYNLAYAKNNGSIGEITITGSEVLNTGYLGMAEDSSTLGTVSFYVGSITNYGGLLGRALYSSKIESIIFNNFDHFENLSGNLCPAYINSTITNISLTGSTFNNSGNVGYANVSSTLGSIRFNVGSSTNSNYAILGRFGDQSTGNEIVITGSTFNNGGNIGLVQGASTLGSITLNVDSFINIDNNYSSLGFAQNDSSIGNITINTDSFTNSNFFGAAQYNSTITSINLNGGSFTNHGQLGCALRGTIGSIVVKGTFTNSQASDFYPKAFFACFVNELDITGSTSIINDSMQSIMGPTPVNMSGGDINNRGVFYTGLARLDSLYNANYSFATSTFTAGSVTGTGSLYLAGHNTFSMPISQGSVMVGYGVLSSNLYTITSGSVIGTLFANDNLTAEINVTGSGSLLGTGTLYGPVTIQGSGQFIPGSSQAGPFGTMSISGPVILEPTSVTEFDFGLQGNNNLNMPTGDLTLLSPAYLKIKGTTSAITTSNLVFIAVPNGLISGTFTILENDLSEYELKYTSKSVLLRPAGLTFVWTGSQDNQWINPYNWSSNFTPSDTDVAQFDITAGAGSTTAVIGTNSCGAGGLDFSGRSYVLTGSTADPADFLLTLNPLGGTAISFGSSCLMGTAQIILLSDGVLYLGPTTSNAITDSAQMWGPGSLTIQGPGLLTVDSSAKFGPVGMVVTEGTLVNQGMMLTGRYQTSSHQYINSTSTFSGGSISGDGTLAMAGFNIAEIPLNQGSIWVGYGKQGGGLGNAVGTLYSNQNLTAAVKVTGSGSLMGLGTIYGDLSVESRGQLMLGGSLDGNIFPVGTLSVYGSVSLNQRSITRIYFDDTGHGVLSINTGNLLLQSPAYLNISATAGFIPGTSSYVIAQLTGTPGSITGQFVITHNDLSGYYVTKTATQILLQNTPTPFEWTGAVGTSWTTSLNWNTNTLPTGSTVAVFGTTTGSITVSVDGTAYAQYLSFEEGGYTLTKRSNALLTLYPSEGTAIFLGSSTLFDAVSIEFNSHGTIILGSESVNTWRNGVRVVGSGSLEIQGNGQLIIDGGNGNLDCNGTILVSGGSITAKNNGFIGFQSADIYVAGTTSIILDNVGAIGAFNTGVLSISDAVSIKSYNTGIIGYPSQGTLTLQDAIRIEMGTTSFMGPAAIHMTGGTIINHGQISTGLQDIGTAIYRPSSSLFSGGSITGRGLFNIGQVATFGIPITQGTIRVGYGVTNNGGLPVFGTVSGTLFANDRLYADVVVTGSGSLLGQGTIFGSVSVLGSGYFIPGSTLNSSTETMTVYGTVHLLEDSTTQFYIDTLGNHSELKLNSGNLLLTSPAYLNLMTSAPLTQSPYVLIDVTPGTITGTFTVTGTLPLGYTLTYTENQVYLESSANTAFWTGSNGTQWADPLNWNTNTIPAAFTTALFNGSAGGSTTVNIGTSTCIAKDLNFIDQPFFMTADSYDPDVDLLTLSSVGGIAINIGSSTIIGTAQIYLDNSGTISINENAKLTLENGARIKGSVSLEVTGSGSLLVGGISRGASSSLASVFSGETLGTVSISGASITNSGHIAYASFNASAGAITVSGLTLLNDSSAYLARAHYSSTLGNVSITAPSITNRGYMAMASLNGTAGAITVTGSTLLNDTSSYFAYAISNSSLAAVVITADSIINSGWLGFAVDNSTITSMTLNGSLINTGSAYFSSFVDGLTMTGSTSIINGSIQSVIGPVPLVMNGGYLHNSGYLFTGLATTDSSYIASYGSSTSSFTSGSVTGSGQMYLAETNIFSIPMTQGSVVVGYGALAFNYGANTITTGSVTGTLFANSSLSSSLNVTGSGSLLGHGLIYGDVGVGEYGFISPGGTLTSPHSVPGTLTIHGSIYCADNSTTEIYFDNSGYDRLKIFGNLILGSASYLTISASTDFQPVAGTYLFIDASTSETLYGTINDEAISYGSIIGNFIVNPLPSNFNGFTLSQTGGAIYLQGTPTSPVGPSLASGATTGNTLAVAKVLDGLDGHTNACLQSKITTMEGMSAGVLNTTLNQMQPAAFKGGQIVLEEMAFVVNDEISKELYDFSMGFKPFIRVGYEHLAQNSYSQYTGFESNASYQLLGCSYGHENIRSFDKLQYMVAIGAQETFTRYKKVPSKSSSTSVLASLGAAGFIDRWSFGLDLLTHFHTIDTSRTIDYFGFKAISSHGAFSIKGQLHGGYRKVFKNCALSPYDDMTYLYGLENSFRETGAECLNLTVDSSHRNVLRNALGLKIATLTKQSIQPFVDVAYVIEARIGGKEYSAQFVNTEAKMTVTGIGNVGNYAKVALGVQGSKNKWDYGVRFNGQYGKRFSETGFSLNVDKQF